ncbi:MAG: hypothetical protein QXV73_04505 [Candidatus Micrarchaeia archaeon]
MKVIENWLNRKEEEIKELMDIIAQRVNWYCKKEKLPIRMLKRENRWYWMQFLGVSWYGKKYKCLGVDMNERKIREFNNEVFKRELGRSINWGNKYDVAFWKIEGWRVKGKWITPKKAEEIKWWNRNYRELRKIMERIKKVRVKRRKLEKYTQELGCEIEEIKKIKTKIRKQVNKRWNVKIREDKWMLRKNGEWKQLEKVSIREIEKAIKDGVGIELDEDLRGAIKKWKKIKTAERRRKAIDKIIKKISQRKKQVEERIIRKITLTAR